MVVRRREEKSVERSDCWPRTCARVSPGCWRRWRAYHRRSSETGPCRTCRGSSCAWSTCCSERKSTGRARTCTASRPCGSSCARSGCCSSWRLFHKTRNCHSSRCPAAACAPGNIPMNNFIAVKTTTSCQMVRKVKISFCGEDQGLN